MLIALREFVPCVVIVLRLNVYTCVCLLTPTIR